jgi:hypothetical protein
MRLLTIALAGAALACKASLPSAPDHLLIGTWTDAATSVFALTLTASAQGAMLATPCWTAEFPPIQLSDSLTFQKTGVVTQAGGLITLHVGEAYNLIGRVVGSDVLVGGVELAPGSVGPRVCNA